MIDEILENVFYFLGRSVLPKASIEYYIVFVFHFGSHEIQQNSIPLTIFISILFHFFDSIYAYTLRPNWSLLLHKRCQIKLQCRAWIRDLETLQDARV